MNAADAFDIGNFDDDEVKGVKVGVCYSRETTLLSPPNPALN